MLATGNGTVQLQPTGPERRPTRLLPLGRIGAASAARPGFHPGQPAVWRARSC